MAGATLLISTRTLGQRKRLLEDWSIDLPPANGDGSEGLTLRELITRIVTANVQNFRDRQERNRFCQVLTKRQIEAQAATGKINSGGSDLNQEVNVEAAVASALESFEDGVYLVILDDVEQRDLDAQVFIKPDSRLVFLRLVMLAGG
ncbi:MAG: hypothetical protein AAF333_00175 [Planctomycetota bacterium]